MTIQIENKSKDTIPLNPDGFFRIAIAEGEGLGTAYEYYAKFHLMKKVLNPEKVKKILVFGLPEKYGYSLDFVLYSHYLDASLVIVDERDERLIKHKQICSELFNDNFTKKIEYVHLNNWSDPFQISPDIDLALSSEVFQRLNHKQREVYAKNLQKVPRVAIFTPNSKNSNHATTSGLKTCSINDLETSFEGFGIKHFGYVDFFLSPPGLHLQKKNKTILKKRSNLVSLCLQSWHAIAEKSLKFMPTQRLHHIVYLISAQTAEKSPKLHFGEPLGRFESFSLKR
jgi:hypothetical protein